MKTYQETIEELGAQKWNDWCCGSFLPTFEGARITAFIYGVSVDKVYDDVDEVFKSMKD